MSVVAYTGLPGAGKSYAAVEHQIMPLLKAHRIVCTNIPLKFDLIRRDVPGCDLREFPLQSIAAQPELMAEAVPPGAILVLDEVWRLFPSGLKANQVPEQFRSFFAEHRHRQDAAGNSTQIVLVTQDLAQIGAFARQLVENTFRIVKLSTLGIPLSNRYRVDMFAGPVAGPNPNTSSAIRQVFGRYDKRIWQYYVSHTQSQVTEEGVKPNEEGGDKRANVFMRPFFRIFIPVFTVAMIGFIAWGVHHLSQKFGTKHDVAKPASGSPEATPAQAPPHDHSPSLLGQAAAKVEGAGPWRVVGTVVNEGHPERSYGVLSSATPGNRGLIAHVKLSKCEVVEDQPTRCMYDGFWYSESGRPETVSAGDEPVKIWSQGMTPALPAKLSQQPAQVLPPARGDPVEGSEQLRMLSQNSAGLDEPRRPGSTYRGVAGR